jgi:hypothetical protein
MSQKKLFLFISVILIFGLCGWYFKSSKAHNDATQSKVVSLKETLSRPLSLQNRKQIQNQIKDSPFCSQFYDDVISLDLSQILMIMREEKNPFSSCMESPTSSWSKEVTDLLKQSCYQKDLKDKAQQESCFLALLKVKAYFILQNARLDDLNSLTYEQLVAHLLDLLTHHLDSPVYQNDFLKTANELNQRNPNNPSIKKALTLAKLFNSLPDKTKAPDPEKAENFFKIAREASELNPQDWQVLEMKLFMLIRTNPKEAMKYAEQLRSQYPQMGLGSYYLSWFAWLQKNREKALTYIQESVSREPSNDRFNTTLQKMPAAQLGDPIFQIIVGLDPAQL